LVFLFMPADPHRTGEWLEAGPRWRFEPPEVPADVVVWLHPPLPPGTPALQALRFAARRERAIASLRRRSPRNLAVRAVHRLSPPDWKTTAIRSRTRTALLSGALVELCIEPRPERILDVVAEQAGALGSVGAFRSGAGGAALVRVRLPGGTEGILRATKKGSPGDPSRAADGLGWLAGAELGMVPRLLGRGEVAGASWSLESVLPGRRPGRVGPDLVRQVAQICSCLPRSDRPITALGEDLEVIGVRYPDLVPALQRIQHRIRRIIAPLPSVMRHGDLWAGNVLVEGTAVSGLVDWGAWHDAAVPGADLVHLFCTEEGVRNRRELGQVWRERPWQSDRFHHATSEYWQKLEFTPTPPVLDAIAVAWWAAQVAGSLMRLPHLGTQEAWTARNVRSVVAALAGDIAPTVDEPG
jgi:phosphotransferase family enzyme